MDSAELQTLLKANHRAVLSTRRRDGTPQLSPVVCALGEDGRLLVSTLSATAKARNVRRSPLVSICVLADGFFGPWVQVDGEATVVELPEAMSLLRYVYHSISGEHPNWEEFERDMVTQERVVLAIRPSQPGREGA